MSVSVSSSVSVLLGCDVCTRDQLYYATVLVNAYAIATYCTLCPLMYTDRYKRGINQAMLVGILHEYMHTGMHDSVCEPIFSCMNRWLRMLCERAFACV